MQTHEIARIVLKVLGIYWLVQAMMYLIQLLLLPFSDMQSAPGFNLTLAIIDWILIGMLYAVVGYLLTFQTQVIMSVVGLDGQGGRPDNVTEQNINYQRLAFSLIGIYFAIPAISVLVPQLIKIVSLRQPAPAYGMYQSSYLDQSWPKLAENAVKFILGMALIIGKDRMIKLIQRLRPLSNIKDEDA